MKMLLAFTCLSILVIWVPPIVSNIVANFKDISAIVQSLSVTLASGFAVAAFDKWRKEIIYTRKVELAEEVADLFAQLPEELEYIISPFISAQEGHSRQKAENETIEQVEKRNLGYARLERLQEKREIFSKVVAFKNRFQLYFGEQAQKPFQVAEEAYHYLYWDAEERYQNAYYSVKIENSYAEAKESRQKEKELLDRIKNARDDIWLLCKPVINLSLR